MGRAKSKALRTQATSESSNPVNVDSSTSPRSLPQPTYCRVCDQFIPDQPNPQPLDASPSSFHNIPSNLSAPLSDPLLPAVNELADKEYLNINGCDSDAHMEQYTEGRGRRKPLTQDELDDQEKQQEQLLNQHMLQRQQQIQQLRLLHVKLESFMLPESLEGAEREREGEGEGEEEEEEDDDQLWDDRSLCERCRQAGIELAKATGILPDSKHSMSGYEELLPFPTHPIPLLSDLGRPLPLPSRVFKFPGESQVTSMGSPCKLDDEGAQGPSGPPSRKLNFEFPFASIGAVSDSVMRSCPVPGPSRDSYPINDLLKNPYSMDTRHPSQSPPRPESMTTCNCEQCWKSANQDANSAVSPNSEEAMEGSCGPNCPKAMVEGSEGDKIREEEWYDVEGDLWWMVGKYVRAIYRQPPGADVLMDPVEALDGPGTGFGFPRDGSELDGDQAAWVIYMQDVVMELCRQDTDRLLHCLMRDSRDWMEEERDKLAGLLADTVTQTTIGSTGLLPIPTPTPIPTLGGEAEALPQAQAQTKQPLPMPSPPSDAGLANISAVARFFGGLLNTYSSLCIAMEKCKLLLPPQVDHEFLQLFDMTWGDLNKCLFVEFVFSDAIVQRNLPPFILYLRANGSKEADKRNNDVGATSGKAGGLSNEDMGTPPGLIAGTEADIPPIAVDDSVFLGVTTLPPETRTAVLHDQVLAEYEKFEKEMMGIRLRWKQTRALLEQFDGQAVFGSPPPPPSIPSTSYPDLPFFSPAHPSNTCFHSTALSAPAVNTNWEKYCGRANSSDGQTSNYRWERHEGSLPFPEVLPTTAGGPPPEPCPSTLSNSSRPLWSSHPAQGQGQSCQPINEHTAQQHAAPRGTNYPHASQYRQQYVGSECDCPQCMGDQVGPSQASTVFSPPKVPAAPTPMAKLGGRVNNKKVKGAVKRQMKVAAAAAAATQQQQQLQYQHQNQNNNENSQQYQRRPSPPPSSMPLPSVPLDPNPSLYPSQLYTQPMLPGDPSTDPPQGLERRYSDFAGAAGPCAWCAHQYKSAIQAGLVQPGAVLPPCVHTMRPGPHVQNGKQSSNVTSPQPLAGSPFAAPPDACNTRPTGPGPLPSQPGATSSFPTPVPMCECDSCQRATALLKNHPPGRCGQPGCPICAAAYPPHSALGAMGSSGSGPDERAGPPNNSLPNRGVVPTRVPYRNASPCESDSVEESGEEDYETEGESEQGDYEGTCQTDGLRADNGGTCTGRECPHCHGQGGSYNSGGAGPPPKSNHDFASAQKKLRQKLQQEKIWRAREQAAIAEKERLKHEALQQAHVPAVDDILQYIEGQASKPRPSSAGLDADAAAESKRLKRLRKKQQLKKEKAAVKETEPSPPQPFLEDERGSLPSSPLATSSPIGLGKVKNTELEGTGVNSTLITEKNKSSTGKNVDSKTATVAVTRVVETGQPAMTIVKTSKHMKKIAVKEAIKGVTKSHLTTGQEPVTPSLPTDKKTQQQDTKKGTAAITSHSKNATENTTTGTVKVLKNNTNQDLTNGTVTAIAAAITSTANKRKDTALPKLEKSPLQSAKPTQSSSIKVSSVGSGATPVGLGGAQVSEKSLQDVDSKLAMQLSAMEIATIHTINSTGLTNTNRKPAGASNNKKANKASPSHTFKGLDQSKGNAFYGSLDDIFSPKEDGDDMDGDFDREVEEFKRFCSHQTVSAERKKISVNLNMGTVRLKLRPRM